MTIETHTVLLRHKPEKSSVTTVAVGYGPPTKQELLVHYPARFTWPQLKAIVNSGSVHALVSLRVPVLKETSKRDLGLLKRDKRLQLRYDNYAADIKKKYGSLGR